MSTPALNPLVEKIRAAHPGAYDDMDDATLTKAVLAKYPQYSDLAAPAIQKPQVNMQPSFLGQALGSDTPRSAIANPQQPAEKFALENPEQQGNLATASGVGAAGALAPVAGATVLPFLKGISNWVAQNPIKTYMAVQAAKAIPGVGPAIQKVPGVDLLPFLASEGQAGATQAARKKLGVPVPAEAAPVTPEAPVEAPPPAPTPKPSQLDDLLRNAVGNQPIKPGVPIKDQWRPTAGHTPVESSAVQSFKYDPDAKEFHVAAKGGTIYTYGDVSPDDAAAFQAADSKGKAWQVMKNNPLVKKNGKAVIPSDRGEEDLTPQLQQMLDQARAKKK